MRHDLGREPLDWGRRYLMCPPDHFTVDYAINPWMDAEATVDAARAHAQWNGLVGAIEAAGGKVDRLTPDPELPDMVFTANAGVVDGNTFIPARMRFPQRSREPELAGKWAEAHGYTVRTITAAAFEGMGDALPFRGTLVAGFGQRSEREAWESIGRSLDIPVMTIELPDPRFYHIDLVFAPLDSASALIAPIGLSPGDLERLAGLVPDPLLLTDEEAMRFAANSIVVGRTVIGPWQSDRLQSELRARGFEPVVAPVDEFLKAGGAVRCLTLPLDVRLSRDLAQSA